ncbi:MAG: hypothetical protein H7Y00_09405 [Fimbriimonadaceae bacterium]|nr:hypothetical protein [Chitinophagales bacterium]
MIKKILSKIKVFIAIIFCFCLSAKTLAQQNDILLFIDSVTIIGRINGDKIFISENDIAYTIQGKIIYKGTEINSDNILLIADVRDVFSKKTGIVYQQDSKTVQYITQKSAIYLGDYPINTYYERLVFMEQKNDSLILLYNGIDESMIGFIEGKNVSSTQIVAAAYLYIKHYKLDEQVHAVAEQKLAEEETAVSQNGVIKQKYGNNIYYEWVWDGKILKPAWGNRPEDEWKFDGKYLQPSWSLDPQSEWVWDGSILKPYWDNSSQNQWTWDGNILKPFWDSNPDKMFILEETTMRPMWSYDTSHQWEIEGNIPLPVIALVVIGIADR